MAGLSSAVSSMVALLIITALGYLAAKLGYLTDSMNQPLSKAILNITLPCTIIGSVSEVDVGAGAQQIGSAFGLAFAMFVVMMAAGFVIALVLRVPRWQRRLYVFMSTFTNVGFMGIAVVSSVFGGGAALLGSIFVAVVNLLFYSFGVQVMSGTASGIKLRNLVNSPLIASAAAILLFFSGIEFPDAIQLTISMTGAITAPLAMMLVGLSIAQASLRNLFTEWRLYGFIVLRMLVLPIAAYLVARLVVTDATVLGVFVVMMGMPVGSLAPTIAMAYGQDPALPTKGTVLTTLASFATVPAMLATVFLLG